jgi:CRP-like cAMP-binding protein/serine/threonine protein phosphatase PrpC
LNIIESLKKAGAEYDLEDILKRAHLTTNAGLRKDNTVDDTLSGTTSISLLLHGSLMYFSNLGDSRAVLVSATPDGRLVAKAMSNDQTPYRKDERERVKKYGARVMTMEQIEGNAPIHENWGDIELGHEIDEGGDPPRIWSPLGDYPGTAFTRSIGDFFAESLGVVADPEFTILPLSENDKYIIIASDGVFEFLTNQMTADVITTHDDLLCVCRAVVEMSYGLWLQYEYRTDDITIILIAIDRVTQRPGKTTVLTSQLSAKRLVVEPGVGELQVARPMSSKPVRRRPKKRVMILSSADEFDDDNDDAIELPEPKTEAERASIAVAIKTNFLFQNTSSTQRDAIIDVMTKVFVHKDEVVILQGDKGDRFYIVEEGRYEVRMQPEEGLPLPADDGRSTNAEYGKYGNWRHEYSANNVSIRPCFGELSLMYGKPRGATVIALEDGVLWALSRSSFKKMLFRSMDSRRRILDNLRRVKILRCLDVSDIQRLADVLGEKVFAAGDKIIEQDSIGDNFYMIVEGRCEVEVIDDKGKAEVVNRLYEWDYFGERALLSNDKHTGNVTALTEVKVLYVNKKSFDEIFGPLLQLIDADRKHREDVARLQGHLPATMREVELSGVIGHSETFTLLAGSFGGVKLTSQSFVVAKLVKAGESGAVAVALEVGSLLRKITDVSQNFLPPLVTALRDSNALHLLFRTAVVGDLASLLKLRSSNGINGVAFDETVIAYMGACVVTALGALHSAGVISRGVQPENLYLDAEGRLVLFDHRTCKVGGVDSLSYTLCGATDYLAPEQVSLGGHGKAVDLWALGVLLYEVATGANPFAAGGEVATFNRISSLGSSSYQVVSVPAVVDRKVKDLVLKLLVADPMARLGMGSSGIASIQTDPLFGHINWKTLYLDSSPLVHFAADLQGYLELDDGATIAEAEGWNEECTADFNVDLSSA